MRNALVNAREETELFAFLSVLPAIFSKHNRNFKSEKLWCTEVNWFSKWAYHPIEIPVYQSYSFMHFWIISIANANNSIQFFIIYVPRQQPQGQLQTQHSVNKSNYNMDNHNIRSKSNYGQALEENTLIQRSTIIVFSPDSSATRSRGSIGSGGASSSMLEVWRGMQYRGFSKGRMLLTELETSARTESKRMTNHKTPQLSRMGLPVHCATFHGLSRLNTRAVNKQKESSNNNNNNYYYYYYFINTTLICNWDLRSITI
jgi:hypothetical protein